MTPEQELELLRLKAKAIGSKKTPQDISNVGNAQPSGGVMREAKIQAQGFAKGVGGLPGFIADVASIPTRTAGGLMAIAGDVSGKPGLRKTGENLFFAPSFTTQASEAVGGAVGRAINAPTDLNSGEKARQTGAEFAGGLLAGGALKGAAQLGGKALVQGAPRVAQALQSAANSRAARFIAPSRPADVVAAYGAGVGSEYAKQYADPNSAIQQIGSALVGGIGGGLATGVAARGSGRILQKGFEAVKPGTTGVGTSLVGPVKEVNPEQKFGALAGSLRASAANAEKQVNSKYKLARELSAGSQVTPQGVAELRARIEALALGTAEENQRKLHANVLANLDEVVRRRNGILQIDDIAENIRRQYTNAGSSLAFAKGEGVRAVDGFLGDALDNPTLVDKMGRKASKAWKDAISSARDKYQRFDDPNDIAKIIGDEIATGRPLAPAQVGSIFKPSAKNSNLTNKWDAALAAVPAGERKRLGQTIKSGIFHDILKDSQVATPQGFEIDEGRLAAKLDDLVKDPAFKRKFTAIEQNSLVQLQAALSGVRAAPRKTSQLLASAFYLLTGQGWGAVRAGGEAIIPPATTNVDEIIRLLNKPIPLRRNDANFVSSVLVPTATKQVAPDIIQQNQEPQVEPNIGPQSSIQQPQRRLSYAEAKRQKGIA